MGKDKDCGVSLAIKVVPKSHKNEILGWENEELKVRLRAVPEKGEANETLLEFLAKSLRQPKSSLEITHGHTSRHKRVRFSGIAQEELMKRLDLILKEQKK